MSHLIVHLKEERQGYPVVIRPGALAAIPAFARRHGGRAWIITDATVLPLYGRALHAALEGRGVQTTLLDVPPGEESKTGRMAARLHDRLLGSGIERGDLLIALGGGVVGDLAGYVAATVLRGVDWIQVPTTLLAQVDSSVGGKVGVDHRRGKNLIGAFHHPRAVFADTRVLRTLPIRQVRAGIAEMVKIAAALDERLFRHLERAVTRRGVAPSSALPLLIRRCVGLKAAVVERDARDRGVRSVLNFGHTIGHAVESAAGFRVLHGEAVAIGVAAESRIAVLMGILEAGTADRIEELLAAAGLRMRLPRSLGPERVLRRMGADKKTAGGVPRFVLPRRIGASVIGVEVPARFVRAALGERG